MRHFHVAYGHFHVAYVAYLFVRHRPEMLLLCREIKATDTQLLTGIEWIMMGRHLVLVVCFIGRLCSRDALAFDDLSLLSCCREIHQRRALPSQTWQEVPL